MRSHALAQQVPPGFEVDARELQQAGAVQARLLPVGFRRFHELEFSALTIPANGVGGDLYDFLRVGPRRLGMVLADVSGHGMPAALLMATLRATLRSDYELVRGDDLVPRLERLNRTLYAGTFPEHYATLFLGEYDGFRHRLRYVNCGHVPPMLLHADGTTTRLECTATAVGMFELWRCEVAEVKLAPGDLLILATDGFIEARDSGGEEFGEDRLVSTAHPLRHRTLDGIQSAIVEAVRDFATDENHDDRTLVLARLREPLRPASLRPRTVPSGPTREE